MKHQNYLYLEYRRAIRKFRKLQTRFEKRIANHTFQELTARRRYQLLSRLRKLKEKIEQLTVRLKLTAARGSLALSLGLISTTHTEGLASSGPTGIGIPKSLSVDKTLLNSDTDGDQENPDAAMNDLGESAFVWESSSNQIMGKGFGSDGESIEFTVTDDSFVNTDPSVSLNNEGDFVVAWTSMEATTPYSTFSIKYMRYEVDGENIIADGPYTLEEGTNTAYESVDSPDVALDENGNFAIVWESYDGNEQADYVKARYVDNENSSDLEIEVSDSYYNDYTHYKFAGSPAVDIANDGNFIIVWEGSYYYYEYPEMEQNYTIYSKRYRENEALESDQIVQEYSTDRLNDPDVALNKDGSYAIVWHDEYNNFSQEYIYVKKFDNEGNELCQITVENTPSADLYEPAIASDKDGAFTVIYDLERSGGYSEILGVRFNQLGGRHEDLVFLDTGGEEEASNPAIAMNAKGDFVAAWEDAEFGLNDPCEENQDCEGTGVYFKKYSDPKNEPYCIVDENQVNEYSTGYQHQPAVDVDLNGNFVVVWQGESSADGSGIIGQQYNPDGTKNGSEFQINTTTDNNQSSPDVAIDGSGHFIVTWSGYAGSSRTGIFAQMYNSDGSPDGSEFRVDQESTTFYSLSEPSVDINSDGDAVIVWEGSYGSEINARVVNGPGSFGGDEFKVNASTFTGNRNYPDVAIQDDDSFVVTWGSWVTGGEDQTFIRRFDSNASALDANDVRISNNFNTQTRRQVIAMDKASGDFMIAFTESAGSYSSILASKYKSDGTAIFEEEELTIHASTSDMPDISANLDGDFAIVWNQTYGDSHMAMSMLDDENELVYDSFEAINPDNGQDGVAVALDLDGNAIVAVGAYYSGGYNVYTKTIAPPLAGNIDDGNEFLVNSATSHDQDNPDIAQNADGDFVVVWADHYAASYEYYNIKAQRYNNEGIRIGSEIQINNETGEQASDPAVALDDSGNFMVVWDAYSTTGGEDDDILASVYNWDGEVVKDDFIINEETSNNQRNPDIAINNEGDFQVIWSSRNSSGDTWDRIYGQVVSPLGVPDSNGNQNLFEINETSNVTILASLAINDDGDIGIPYVYQYDGTNNGFYVFDSSFEPIVSDLAFSETSYADAYPPGITANEDGDFILAWSEYDLGEEAYYLMSRKYSSGTSFEADAVNIGELESEVDAHIVSVDDGDFMISYTQYEVEADLYSVYLRRISHDLDPIGPEMKINDISASGSTNNSIASSPDGSYTVAWQSSYADGSDEAIIAKQFLSHKPTVESEGLTVDEGAEADITADELLISNPSGGDESPLLKVTLLPSQGTLKLDGNPITVNQQLDEDDMFFLSYEHNGDESTFDLFTFTVANEDFETGSNSFYISVNPVNDEPTLVNPIPDQSTTGFEAFSYTVPSNTFSDVESEVLTLSATLADGSALPSWLSFSASGAFNGTVENDPDFDRTIAIKVSASDGEASVSDEFNIAIASVLTVDESNPNGVHLYPNPTEGQLHLRPPADMIGTIDLYMFNASGQLLDQSRVEQTRASMVVDIDIAHLKKGLYLLKLVNENTTTTYKINKD
ncbi:putative Ig domain-containing protein [Reichenbachiella sp.]|uniref:putative Ig domain-containing protein n=1 Tax=Reichenbachiella sp. TaxID=2184521 RepID=UPI003BB09141